MSHTTTSHTTRTEAADDLRAYIMGALVAYDQPTRDRILDTLDEYLVGVEREAASLPDYQAAVDALERLAPHILMDGSRCYCSIFGKWFEYKGDHDSVCTAARDALRRLRGDE
jgi:hypothetical protein